MVKKSVTYRNLYANYDYGQGKVYAVFIRSNNSAASATNGNNAATLLGNVGVLVTGTAAKAEIDRFYNIVQFSADYQVSPQLRVGALVGKINDTSKTQHGAIGGSVGAFYSLSKRTTLLALAETLHNEDNAGFRPSGSAGVSPNFAAADVNGQIFAVRKDQAAIGRHDVDVSEQLPPVHADPALLERAVANLVANAARFKACGCPSECGNKT